MNTNNSFYRTLRVLWCFITHDIIVYKQRLSRFIRNYAIIYPILYIVAFAYLQTNTYFGHTDHKALIGTIAFSGNIVYLLACATFALASPLLFDLEHNKYIQYELNFLPPSLLLLRHLLFGALFTFLLVLPFFPLAKIMVGSLFVTTNTNWISLFLILAASALCCSAYHLLAMISLKSSHSLETLWCRITLPLQLLGGTWAPLYTIKAILPMLTIFLYANPFTFITEGTRRALTGSDNFLPVPLCIGFLLFFTALMTGMAIWKLKRRLDYI